MEFLPPTQSTGLDSIYVRDASVVCEHGVILCNMGKVEREAEPAAQAAAFRSLNIPIRGEITGEGRLEGGDVTWIDAHTVAVGRGYRTNEEGIRQLRALLGDCVDEFLVVPLPHHRGPADVFHLMSILSPIDRDLMLVYSPLMPVSFREALLARGIQLVEMCDAEFETEGCNVLTVAPRKCIMLEANRPPAVGATTRWLVPIPVIIKTTPGPNFVKRLQGVMSGSSSSGDSCDPVATRSSAM